MSRRGFSLRLFFVAVTLLCFLAWTAASLSMASCVIPVVAWSIAGAAWARTQDDNPFLYGAASGAVAVVAFIVAVWPVFLCGYFFHDGPEEYFEDGFAVEAFFYPVVYCVVYAPFGAIIGSFTGFAVWVGGELFGRPARDERPSPPADPFASAHYGRTSGQGPFATFRSQMAAPSDKYTDE